MKDVFSINYYLLKANKKLYFGYFLLSLFWCFTPLFVAFVVSKIFDNMNNGLFSFNYIFIFALLIMQIANILLAKYSGIVDAKITFFVEQSMQISLLKEVLTNKKENKSMGIFLDTIENDIIAFTRILLIQIEFLCNIIFLVLSFFVIAKLNYTLTFLVVLPLIVISSILFVVGEKFKTRYSLSREDMLNYSIFFSDALKNYESIQFIAKDEDLIESFTRQCLKRGQSKLKREFFLSLANNSINFSHNIFIGLTILLSLSFIESQSITIGILTLFFSYISNGFTYVILFGDVITTIKSAEDSLSRLSTFFDGNKMKMWNPTNNNHTEYKSDISCLEFKEFKMVENDISHSFKIPYGSTTVIVGGNSSGKSRLVDCILGYAKFYGKIILYDMDNIKINEPYTLGYVPQNNILLSDSIENNISLFENDVDFIEALRLTNLYDVFVENNHNFIGSGGKRLSEGQRQRLCITRALAVHNNILILDESLSYVDPNNRKIIYERLINLPHTKIIITDDEKIISKANIVISMKDSMLSVKSVTV